MRLTVGQAICRFLAVQHSERDGVRQRLIPAVLGIFGHGNVAGLGQGLLEAAQSPGNPLPYYQGRNEQAMVHTAVGFARQRDRLATLACTTSIGPGATNLVTGAALATVNRIPVLLMPGDTFATRRSGTVLQQLESAAGPDISVNDTLRPVSVFFDRVHRPEQLASALMGAMRALTDPAATGAVTLALPQDVQAEAHDFPDALFAERVWHVHRPEPDAPALAAAAQLIRGARRPLIVAGGGVIYAAATSQLAELATATGVPVAMTQAGKGSLPDDDPLTVGAIGATGTAAANELARRADLVIGIGTRYSDFTTASQTAFADPDVRFVNINLAPMDAGKLSALMLVADARQAIAALTVALAGYRAPADWTTEGTARAADWAAAVAELTAPGPDGDPPTQNQVLGAVNRVSGPRDVIVCAAGSLPGDLHRLWRTRDRKGYHVEYGFSCMGYEIPGGIGVKLAAPDRTVFVMVGDGSYLMMPGELATAVAERVPIVVVLIDNQGYASIGALSESVGSQRFGTRYRIRGDDGRLTDLPPPVDLAANAESLGATVIRVAVTADLEPALRSAAGSPGPVVVHVTCDPIVGTLDSESWWDVPVAETSQLESTTLAREHYVVARKAQREHLRPVD